MGIFRSLKTILVALELGQVLLSPSVSPSLVLHTLFHALYASHLHMGSKVTVSQLVIKAVNSGNAVLASNYTTRFCGSHTGMDCDLKGVRHCLNCVWLAKESKINCI